MPDYVQISVDIRDSNRVIVTRESTSEEGELSKDPRLLDTIDVLSKLLTADRLERREEFALLGSCLFDFLFQGPARQRMRDWLSEDARDRVLRIVLKFSPSVGDVGSYPWEYLYVPPDFLHSRNDFLAASEELVLSRHVRLDDERLTAHRVPAREQLRIYVGIASPQREELPRWSSNGANRATASLPSLGEQTQVLLEELGGMKAEVKVERDLDLAKLSAALGRGDDAFRPHVVHLVAHGTYVDNEGGGLALCTAGRSGMAAWTRDTDVADCFRHLPNVVFLHACNTGVTDQIRGFRGVALQLVRRGVPAVVAMNFEIDAGTAATFATAFYDALAKGEPIDRAVQLGRRVIGIGDSTRGNFRGRAFGCPVAFVQAPEAAILPAAPSSELEPGPDEQATGTGAVGELHCPGCYHTLFTGMRLCRYCKLRVEPCASCQRMRGQSEACPWCGYEPADVRGGTAVAGTEAGAAGSTPPAGTTPSGSTTPRAPVAAAAPGSAAAPVFGRGAGAGDG